MHNIIANRKKSSDGHQNADDTEADIQVNTIQPV